MRPIASLVPVAEAAPRVLVVDDSSVRREQVASLLLHDGYEVHATGTINGVVDAIEAFDPDLAILASSESIDGVALCGELRSREFGNHIPVILMGDATDEETIARALLGGAEDYVSEPSREIELSARVRVQLRTKRMLDALTRLRAERDTFRREASHDPLTGLQNRRALEDAVVRTITRGETFAVLFVDIDHFKNINDSFGHAIGDIVLRTVADRMMIGVRQQDVCARYGGEEFVVLLARAAESVAKSVAERHRASIESTRFERTGYPEKVTVSIGVAVFDPLAPDRNLEAFLRRADGALYEAKRTGRNRVVVAAPIAASIRPDIRSTSKIPEPHISDVPGQSSTMRRVVIQQPGALPEPGMRGRLPAPSTEPPPLLEVALRENGPSSAVERELRRRLDERRTALPILPEVALAALRLAGDPKANVSELVKLVEKSPPIAARFLAIANSAIYSRGIKVTSIHVAVVRMGLGGARDVLFQMSYEAQTAGLKHHRTAVTESFSRSVVAAHVCRAASGKLGLQTEYDYLAGLLHDIGEAHVYRVLDGMNEQPSEAVVLDLVRRYHANAGAEVARAWHLPDEIIRVCSAHHDPVPTSGLLRLVMFSDLVVAAAASSEPSFDASKLEFLGVDEELALSLVEGARAATTAI